MIAFPESFSVPRRVAVLTAIGLFLVPVALLAQTGPRIGYVYPAGGKAGSTIQVNVGGQLIEFATNVISFTGEGIHAVAVDFHKPMPMNMFQKLRDEMRVLQAKQQAWAKAMRQGGKVSAKSTNAWTAADEKQLREIQEKIAKNPPNRNANPAIAEVVTLRVSIDPDAAPGDREIRLGNAGVLSNPLKFKVGLLPEVSCPAARAVNPDADKFRERLGRPGTNSVRTELRVTPPVVINGQIMPGVVDRYRFSARRGQQFVMAVSARELIPYIADAVPGWFQAALTLYDAKGREVAYDDDFRFHPDPVMFCRIPADGDYVLEVKDAIYRGREDFVYRITLGELPYVTGVYPLGGAAGKITEVEVTGWNLPTQRASFDARQASDGVHTLVVMDGTNVIGGAPFAVDACPDVAEAEPNNSTGAAQAMKFPVIVNGRIAKSGDVDVFRVRGRAGERLVAEVMARRLDSPLDGVLQLLDAAGKQLAANDDNEDKASGLDTHHADPRLEATLPSDGEYYVRLADTQGKGGCEFAYRLRISPPQPDFALRLVPSAINLRGGGSAAVTVHALRRDGFTNEITLAVKDAPPGFTISGGKIPAGQDQVKATLNAASVASAEHFRIKLEGRATIAGQSVVRPVVPADDLMQAFFYRHLVPAQEMQVSVVGGFRSKGGPRILSPSQVSIPVGGTASVQIAMWSGGFTDKAQFELTDPPEGISIKSCTPTKGGVEIILQSDATKAKSGTKGNLILSAFAGKSGTQPGKAAAGRTRKIASLPALPFEITAAEK
jgi:hypothetical protein